MSNEYLVGKTILGYEIQELIGSGGFGKVYKGVKKVGKDEYYAAIKHISLPKDNEYNDMLNSMGRNYDAVDKYYEKILEDMINEINTLFYLSKKDNKNIVTYYDHDIVKYENPLRYDIFIRMEYLKPLNIYSNEGNMTIEDAINLGIDIARALDKCHKQGIIHRDVKDGNIFINEDGDFKLGDFGIARMLSDSNQTLSMKGTPIFMAPEVVLGKYYDKTVDIYSLGIVLYRLLNYNRIPFLPKYPEIFTARDTDIAMNRRLSGERFDKPQNASEELGKVILKACEVQGSRYNHCEELISDLIKVKSEMDKDRLSKLLFETFEEENKREVQNDVEDTYVLTQNDMDDTVILDNSFEECQDNAEYIINDSVCESCLDNSIDDTMILETNNEDNLLKNEFINETDDIKTGTNIYNKLPDVPMIKSKLKIGALFGVGIAIATSICLVSGLLFSKDKNIPKEMDRRGSVSGNYTAKYDNGVSRSNIVSDSDYIYYCEAEGIIRANHDNTEQEYLTSYDAACLNLINGNLYHIELETKKVKRLNLWTNVISNVSGIEANQICTINADLFYDDLSGERIYKRNLHDQSTEIIFDAKNIVPQHMIDNGDRLINLFSVTENELIVDCGGIIYRVNLKTGEVRDMLSEIPGQDAMALYDNCVLSLCDNVLTKINFNENEDREHILDRNIKAFTLEDEFLYYIDIDGEMIVKNLVRDKEYYLGQVTGEYINVSSKVIYTENEGSLYIYEFNENNF